MELRKARLDKMGARRDGGGNKSVIRRTFASVDCARHGQMRDLTKKQEVYCTIPATKRAKYSGCPLCAKERREALIK